ncbi:MAG: MarR family winged helix-turn-helix transcriptional regulator [Acidothermaceae bacterium]
MSAHPSEESRPAPAATAATPRWLDAADQRVWRSYLAATQLLTERLDQELQRESGMPHAYYEVLVRLSEVEGRALRMSELADRSLSSRSRLSHAVARLEEAGWVRREACPTDRRGQLAVLTDAGFAALEAAAPVHVEGVRSHLFDQLTPDQVRQLGEICTAVADHLRADRPDSSADAGAAPA